MAEKSERYNFKLLARMERLGWTQKALATQLDISPGTFSMKINGKAKFTKCERFCIAALLHMDPNDIE